jgi:hypothetical protein
MTALVASLFQRQTLNLGAKEASLSPKFTIWRYEKEETKAPMYFSSRPGPKTRKVSPGPRIYHQTLEK